MDKPPAPRYDKEAKKTYNRWYYQQNKDKTRPKIKANSARHRQSVRDFLNGYLDTHPCVDCGETDRIVLEFDHREPALKEFTIGAAAARRTALFRVKNEVDKCDVRCCNCHRRRTYQQQREKFKK